MTPDPLDALKYAVFHVRGQLEFVGDQIGMSDADNECAQSVVDALRTELAHLLAPFVRDQDDAETYRDGSRVRTTSDPFVGVTQELFHLPAGYPSPLVRRL